MKKKFLVITLISALILSCSAFVIGLMPEKAMAAEGDGSSAVDPPASPQITMAGASIRTAAPFGLRFETEIDQSVNINDITELGMYLCPTDLLGESGKFPDDMSGMLIPDGVSLATETQYIKRVVVGGKEEIKEVTDENGTHKRFYLALVNIVPSNLDRKFSAMAYIKIGEGEETKADSIERSVAYVAREAKADRQSGLEGDSAIFVDKIIADSNELSVLSGVADMAAENRHNGQFSRKITLTEATKELKLRVNYKKMEGADKCSLEMYAKAVNDVTIGGQTVSKDGFTKLHFENLDLANQELTLSLAGTGDLWIDDIKYTRISNADGTAADIGGENVTRLGVDRLKVLGYIDSDVEAAKIRDTTMTKDEATGYMVYSGDNTAGASHSRFYIENETDLPGDVYLAFKFKISDNTHVEDMRKGDSYEGLWMQAWVGANNYMQIFDEEGYDRSIYRKQWDDKNILLSDSDGVDFTSTYGSLNRSGYDMKRNTWYYAVTCYKGVNKSHEDRWTSVYSCFYTPFEITFGDVYTLTEEAKNAIFKRNMRAPTVIAEETLSVEAGCDAGVNPSKYGIDEDIICTSSDEGIATVDNAGNVHGVKVGTCTITVKAGAYSSTCAVTVTPKPPKLELHKENIKEVELNLSNITYDPTSISNAIDLQIDEKGYLSYKSRDNLEKPRDATLNTGGFKINTCDINSSHESIAAGDYMVFVLKYSADTEVDHTDKDGNPYYGVWFADCQWYKSQYNRNYTCLDSEFKNCGTGSGTMASMQKDKTKPETWYYLVSPTDGHDRNENSYDNYYASDAPNFEFTIAHIYAVSKDIRDALVGGYYEKDIISVDQRLAVDPGKTRSLNAVVKQLGNTSYTLHYSSDNPDVATVTDGGVVEGKSVGSCTITISAEGLDSVSCEVAVVIPRDISTVEGVRVLSGTDGNPLLVMDGTSGNDATVTKDEASGYWLYKYKGEKTGGAYAYKESQMKVTATVNNDEFIVYQVKYTRTNVSPNDGCSYPTMVGGNEADYLKGYDSEGNSLGVGVTPPGPGWWHFLVLPVAGNQTAALSYYPEFEYYISNVYAVTQAGLDNLSFK